MPPLSRRQYINKISKRDHSSLIQYLKEQVKSDPDVQEMFDDYGVPIDAVDRVHVEFCELPVSAKTKDKKIYINEAMLEPDSDVDPLHYLVHEITHMLQQLTGNADDGDVDDYLSKETEQEAFNVQWKHVKRTDGEEEADNYIDELLDYHDKSGKEREEVERELKEE